VERAGGKPATVERAIISKRNAKLRNAHGYDGSDERRTISPRALSRREASGAPTMKGAEKVRDFHLRSL
jgi:hypothetical protein